MTDKSETCAVHKHLDGDLKRIEAKCDQASKEFRDEMKEISRDVSDMKDVVTRLELNTRRQHELIEVQITSLTENMNNLAGIVKDAVEMSKSNQKQLKATFAKVDVMKATTAKVEKKTEEVHEQVLQITARCGARQSELDCVIDKKFAPFERSENVKQGAKIVIGFIFSSIVGGGLLWRALPYLLVSSP